VIQSQLFYMMEKLTQVNLDENNIREIHPNSFQNVRSLKLLDLRGNTCFDALLRKEIQNKIKKANMCPELNEMKVEAASNRKNFLLIVALILESIAISIMLIVCFLFFKKMNELYQIIQGMI
jgi:hypothetical protein